MMGGDCNAQRHLHRLLAPALWVALWVATAACGPPA